MLTLDMLNEGERGRVVGVHGQGGIHQRLLEMGVVDDAEIELVRFAPLGDPMEVIVCGYHLLLRRSEAALVSVEKHNGVAAAVGSA